MDEFFALQTLSNWNLWANRPKDRLYTFFERLKSGKIDSVFENRVEGEKIWATLYDFEMPYNWRVITLTRKLWNTARYTTIFSIISLMKFSIFVAGTFIFTNWGSKVCSINETTNCGILCMKQGSRYSWDPRRPRYQKNC